MIDNSLPDPNQVRTSLGNRQVLFPDDGDRRLGDNYPDPITCFEAWSETGNLNLAVIKLYEKGYRSTRGGPIGNTTLYRRACEYIAWNPEIAREHLEQRNQVKYSDKDWQELWVSYSCAGMKTSRAKFVRWVNHFGLNTPEYIKVFKAFFDEQERVRKAKRNPFAGLTVEDSD